MTAYIDSAAPQWSTPCPRPEQYDRGECCGQCADVPTIDSDTVCSTPLFGILNAQGQFWTPLAFPDEPSAAAHLAKHATGPLIGILDTHKIVPVRVVVTAL